MCCSSDCDGYPQALSYPMQISSYMITCTKAFILQNRVVCIMYACRHGQVRKKIEGLNLRFLLESSNCGYIE